jgi:hypothetical protein
MGYIGVIYKYNKFGKPVVTFGVFGKTSVIASIPSYSTVLNSVTINDDESIMVSVSKSPLPSPMPEMEGEIGKYSKFGRPDLTFGSLGYASYFGSKFQLIPKKFYQHQYIHTYLTLFYG